MKPNKQGHYKTFFLLLFLISGILPPGICLAQEKSSNKKTLDRWIDPVIIRGEQLSDLLSIPINHLCLYRYKYGGIEPIPFQVDERNAEGDFVMTEGEMAGLDEDEGRLDENDELVFMARDLGDRMISEHRSTHGNHPVEIEVTDPLTRSKGWAYVMLAGPEEKRSPLDYVRYEFQDSSACITQKTTRSCTDFSLNYTNHISLLRNGQYSENVLDRIKLRIHFKLRKYLTGRSFHLNEASVDAEPVGYKDGPVRVIEQERHKVKVLWITFAVKKAIKISYPYHSIQPFTVTTPINMNTIFKKAFIKVYLDFNRLMEGSWFFSDCNKPVRVDGIMSTKEQELDRLNPQWMAMTNADHTNFLSARFDPALLAQVQTYLYYKDDPNALDPPESVPGQTAYGMVLDLSKVKKGSYAVEIYRFGLPGSYHQEQVNGLMKVIHYPLQVISSPLHHHPS